MDARNWPHSVEQSARFVGTADLDLPEGRLHAVAALGWALNPTLLCVVPRALAAEDVLPFLALKRLARVQRFVMIDGRDKRARAALELVSAALACGYGEDVRAVGADLRCGRQSVPVHGGGVWVD